MNEQSESLIRHLLTTLGVLMAVLGLINLDKIWYAGLVIAGLVVSIYGFFRNKDRFNKQT